MAVRISPVGRQQFFSNQGAVAAGMKLFTYAAGTANKLSTYTDSTGNTANANPIVLDSAGRTPSGLWLTDGSLYKFVLAPANDTDPPTSPIWTEDNIGTNDATLAAIAGATGASLVGFQHTGTGAQVTNLQARGRKVFYSSDYDTLANAITAAAGGVLRVLEGTHTLTAGLTITSSIEIEMEPGAVLDFTGVAAGTALKERKLIHVQGTKGSNVSLAANVEVGDVQIQLTSTGSFTAGDYFAISSDELYSSGAAGGSPTRGFIARVKSVDSASLMTMDQKSPFSFATASNAKVNKLTMVDGVVIRGGKILGGGVGDVHNGIYAYCTTNLRVENVEIDDCEDTGISLDHSVAFSVRDNIVSDATSPGGAIGNTGYGAVAYDGSRDGIIEGNHFYNCRHSVSGGGSPSTFGVEVRGNRATNCGIGTQAYDCHEPCFYWSFIGNRGYGGEGGLIVRGSYTLVDGNQFVNTSSVGIKVKPAIADSNPTPGTRIVNNLCVNTGSQAIELDGDNSQITAFIVRGNMIKTTPLNGIFGQYLARGVIADNVIDDVTSNTGTAGNGIQLAGAAVGDVEDITISGNKINDTLRNGISVRYGRRVSVDGDNTVTQIVNSAVFLQDFVDCKVNGNTLIIDQASNNYGIELDTGDGLIASKNRIKGLAANANSDGIRAYAAAGTNENLTFTDNFIDGCGRHAIHTTASNNIIATGNNVAGVSSANKINLDAATVYVKDANLEGTSALVGTATFNPADLADGVGETTTVGVAGAALGDFVEVSFSLDLQGIQLTAWVSSAGTVSVRFQNETTSTINLGSGTLRARVRKQ